MPDKPTATPVPAAPPSVVHLSTVHPALDARIFYREALHLHENGFRVTVYGVGRCDQRVEGLSVRALPAPPGRFRRLATSWVRALRIIWRDGADLYHLHDPELLPAALLGKLLLRRHVIYDAHEDVSLILLKDWLPRGLRRPLAAVIEALDRGITRRLDAVVVPTIPLLERYRRFARRAEVFHNFPAPQFLRQRDQQWRDPAGRPPAVVHLGTLSRGRMGFLLQTAQAFLRDNPTWTWTFLGLHPPMLEWFNQNRPLGLDGRLFGQGKLPHLDVARRLCEARIGVNYHPLASRQVQVAIPLKVFEYLASGQAVISTRVPELVRLTADCPAVAFADEDQAGYLRVLNGLARNPRLAELGKLGREYCDGHFSCELEGRRLADLYRRILSGRP